MQISRRNFLENSLVTGAALLYLPSNADTQTPSPQIFGLDALRHEIERAEENSALHNFSFETIAENKKVIVSAFSIEGILRLDTNINFTENGYGIILNCFDMYVKGYIDGCSNCLNNDYVSFMLSRDNIVEHGSFRSDGTYNYHHMTKSRDSWNQDGFAFYDGSSFILDGFYRPEREDEAFQVNQQLSARSIEGFKRTQQLYPKTLQQVIFEMEKQGKLVLSR